MTIVRKIGIESPLFLHSIEPLPMKNFLTGLILLANTFFASSQTSVQPTGSGTSSSPYEIASIENLYWVSQNSSSWNSYFIQTQDINAAATANWTGNFPPIGSVSPYFKGSYDGSGFVIDSLVISTSQYAGALFGRVTASGSSINTGIRNLGVSNASITNSNYTPMLTGGIVAYLIGGAAIEHCWFTGTVNSVAGYSAGGIVGAVDGNSTVNQCWSSGDIYASNYPLVFSAPFVGGIAGEFRGTMTDCYTTVDIHSGTTVGGLCGAVYNVYGPGVIERCYASGSAPSGSNTLVGTTGSASPTFSNLYYNSDTYVGLTSSGVTSGATSLTNTQMQQSTSFGGFNFSGMWSIIPGKNSTWPVLDSTLPPCSTPINRLLNASQTTFCQPDFAQISADSGYSYLWNTGDTTQILTVFTTGEYYVTLTTSDGCTANSDTLSILAKPAVVAPTISHTNMGWVTEGALEIYTVPFDSAYTYVWGVTGGTIAVGQYTNGIAVQWGLPDSSANVWVVVSNGTCSETDSISLVISGLSIQEFQSEGHVFPNPNNGLFTLKVDEAYVGASYEVVDTMGRPIKQGVITSVHEDFDLGDNSNGIYHILIRSKTTSESMVVIVQ